MRWLVKVSNDTLGPVEDNTALEILRAHPGAFVRGEGGGQWMAAADSPFAALIAPVSPLKPAPRASGAVKYKVAIVLVVVSVLWAFAAAKGWVGILIGLALGAWTVDRHRKGRPSLLKVVFDRGHSIVMTAGTVLLAAALVIVGANALLVARERERAVEVERQAERDRQAARQTQRSDLQRDLPSKLTSWREKLSEASHLADEAASGLGSGIDLTKKISREVDHAIELLGTPTPELLAIQADCGHLIKLLQARSALPKNVSDIVAAVVAGKKSARKRAWVEASQSYDEALALLSEIQGHGEALAKYVPAGFDPVAKRSEITKLKANIAAPLAQEKKRLEREEAKRKEKEAKEAAYAALCGPQPTWSAYDGEIVGLESHIARTAHDPDSIDVENCTTPRLTSDECWVFTCQVRGKNMFGALILKEETFSYSKALGFVEK